MAAYNAGEGRVRRSIKYEHTRDYWKMKTLPRATRNYVPHVLAAAAISIKPEKYGFRSFKPRPVWDYDTLTINGSYELEKIARVCGVKFSTVMELNPELRKMRTPAYEYTIRLPKGKRPLLEQELKNIEKASESRLYVVKAGDNLSKISQRFSVNIEDIMIVNQLRSKERIYVGQKLQIPSNGTAYLSSGSMHKKDPSKPDLSTTHRKIEYIVKRGDTLGEIAEIYDTRASRIRLWNGLVYGEHIYPEQMLNIWIPKNAAYDMEEYVTVRPGDSLYIIANQRGMTLNELKRLNPNLNYSKIFPGDKIRVR